MSSPTHSDFPLAEADLCVKCGLCLPHCPTYRLNLNEGDSPRGRIALMQGLATAAIDSRSPRLLAHLDGCLGCRACEAVCPAQVPYSRLLDASRALLAERQPGRTRLIRWMGFVLRRRWLRHGLGWLLWLYPHSGLQGLVRRLGSKRLIRLDSLLPPPSPPPRWQTLYPAQGTFNGSVALFTGCLGELAESRTLQDAITLLNRLGYEVRVPPAQTCCGALSQHNGLPGQARRLASLNLAAFAGTDTIIGPSSGCTATLREYDALLSAPEGRAFGTRVQDLCGFLAKARGWERLRFRPLAQTIAVHEPCTLRNVLKDSAAAYDLLRRIPGLSLVELPGNHGCCGAAGSYFLTEAETADRLATDTLATLLTASPDGLVSSNVGCALHLAAGLRRAGRSLPLLHPVSLLVRQLEPASLPADD